ncbi:hypothetical protein LPJ70_002373 [Coemansia sp. RSA 2708]|nr:hypothetical protein LPJ70_002373 [Coemansia sp. RSA 2708]
MFPSLGLLAKVDCPHKSRCHRGALCLFKHPPDHQRTQQQQQQRRRRDAGRDGAAMKDEILLEDTLVAPQAAHVEPPQPVSKAALPAEPAAPSNVPQPADIGPKREAAAPRLDENVRLPESTCDTGTGDWRALTLNYDQHGPAFDPATERQPCVPQLKAVVGDKVGYARRQRALQTIFQHFARIDADDTPAAPWMPAMHAVLCEAELYDSSVSGTYHGKLLTCIKALKQRGTK